MIQHVEAIDISEVFTPARNFGSIASILNLIIPALFTLVSLLTLLMVIYGSYRFMTAGGDAENLQATKKIYKWAILGFVISILSFLLSRLVSRILNIDPFT